MNAGIDTAQKAEDEIARRAATAVWASDEIEIDDDATVIHLNEVPCNGEEGAAWVQAWVYVTAEEIDGAA